MHTPPTVLNVGAEPSVREGAGVVSNKVVAIVVVGSAFGFGVTLGLGEGARAKLAASASGSLLPVGVRQRSVAGAGRADCVWGEW